MLCCQTIMVGHKPDPSKQALRKAWELVNSTRRRRLAKFSSNKLTRKIKRSKVKRKCADKNVQTISEEDWALIADDALPEIYWRKLAETRRIALNEALRENEKLHEQIMELEEDRNSLEELLQEAKELALLVNNHEDIK